jgi:hypothetical protein
VRAASAEQVVLQSWTDGQKWPSRLHQVVPVSVRGGLGAIAEAGLGEDIRDVVRDCVQANEQLIGDLLVGLAFCDQLEDFDLPVGELVRMGGPCRLREGCASFWCSVFREEEIESSRPELTFQLRRWNMTIALERDETSVPDSSC